MNKVSIEQFEDSYDQAKITQLKNKISLSKIELFELVNDDNKFIDKLKYFNKEGCSFIEKEEFYQAIVYLNQAELILEYAASCGKTIERSLILITLHNLASVYQRIWELQKSADYIEGIIYNITAFIDGQQKFKLREEILDDKSNQSQQIYTLFLSKQKLVKYYLQFCAVSSQLKRHENSLNAASKSLDILKEICQQLHEYEIFKGMKYYNQLQKNMLQQLRNIKDFKEENADIDKNIQRFLNKAKKSIGMFQKKIKFNYKILDQKEQDQLHQFSIGAIMQIYPEEVNEMSDKKSLKQELTPKSKIYKALYISIAHFTMATELRLIVNNRYGLQNNTSKKFTTEFKSSQLHHLIAIITVALYVPYETSYFQHILNSFKNHYQVDLTIITESILSQEMSNSIQSDDGIHLELSSMYKKKVLVDQSPSIGKYKIGGSEINGISTSPSVENHFRSRSKPKIKTSKMSVENKEHNSIKLKCRMITDSQGQHKQVKSKNNGKSVNKKSKSKKKSQCSKGKQTLQSPVSNKKSINLQQKNINPQSSRSKGKNKSKSIPKLKNEPNDKKKQKSEINVIKSQYEYGSRNQNERITKIQRPKKNLRSSQKRPQMKKLDNEKMIGTDIRFIRNGKSPMLPTPKPYK